MEPSTYAASWMQGVAHFREKAILPDTLQDDFQMLCQLIHCCRLHFHFIAQGVTFQFNRADSRDHARVIDQRFARKWALRFSRIQ